MRTVGREERIYK